MARMTHLSEDQIVSILALFGADAPSALSHAASCKECAAEPSVLMTLRNELGRETALPEGTVERILAAVPFETESAQSVPLERPSPPPVLEWMDRFAGFALAPLVAAASSVFLGGLAMPTPTPTGPSLALAGVLALSVGSWFGLRGVRVGARS